MKKCKTKECESLTSPNNAPNYCPECQKTRESYLPLCVYAIMKFKTLRFRFWNWIRVLAERKAEITESDCLNFAEKWNW